MADNLDTLDATGQTKRIRTTESGGVHEPHVKANLRVGGADVAGGNPVPTHDADVLAALAPLATAAGVAAAKTVLDSILASLQSQVVAVDATIDQTDGATAFSITAAIDLADKRLVRIALPAAWTAADLTFSVSYDGINFNNLFDEFGAEVVVKAAASRSIRLNITDWLGVKKLKIRSGTSATPVNQTTGRALRLITVM